tara:strand:+ start:489 stop:770 length:282 start_codon:yes stop_codon:yes gene_type:complete
MSDQLSVEVILNDFDKLKEMFNTHQETLLWDTFSNLDFNFNKTLNALLDNNNDILDIPNDNTNQKKKKFRPMDALAKIFKNNNDNSHDYQPLD